MYLRLNVKFSREPDSNLYCPLCVDPTHGINKATIKASPRASLEEQSPCFEGSVFCGSRSYKDNMDCGALVNFFFTEGYMWDWIAAAAAIVINLAIPTRVIKPLHRHYNATDPALSYPAKESSVPTTALYVLVFVLPAVVFAVAAIVKRSGGLVDWHHAALSVAEGFALTCGFKRWTNLVGVLRPNWLSILKLDDAAESDDARLAYPSGHSAYMFFSATIISLYLMGKLQLLARPSQLLFFKSILAVTPIMLALFVAVSRIADYKHSTSDVNAGCFIGMICGAFAYFLNYPSLFSPDCAEPKRRGDATYAAPSTAATSLVGASAGPMDPNLVKHIGAEELRNMYSGEARGASSAAPGTSNGGRGGVAPRAVYSRGDDV